MAVVYVKEQGAMVQRNGGRVRITKKSGTLLELPVSNLDGIALFGNVQMTTQALHFLLKQGVDISYYSYGGEYLGQTAAESSKNIFLRFAQYELYNDKDGRLNFAKIIVRNKIENQLAMIRHHRWDGENAWKDDVSQMQKILAKVDTAGTANELLGIEGKCSSIYFHSFGMMFHCDFEFHGRNRRPPRDPINVIISLGYTFLTKEICSALEAESFEPYLGFFHGIRYGRKSLALDIIEEFRQPVVDRMALKLFNKRMLSKYDFDVDDDRVLLNEDGFKKFCGEYERWMTQSVPGAESGYRALLRGQIACLKQSIQKGAAYVPYRWEG
ncbi:MAG: CRISPR-associated endonuclease Cas1 [Lachnospiraceae bacterium]|nr:CRISPR-associated endonuclease Cas1 [Lachnospiraceae bacterium]